MIKDNGNIEELMKQAFDGFEADVPANAWANIESGIKKTPSSSHASSASKGLWIKTIGIAAVTAGIVTGIVLFTNSDDVKVNNSVSNTTEMPIIENQNSKNQNSNVVVANDEAKVDPIKTSEKNNTKKIVANKKEKYNTNTTPDVVAVYNNKSENTNSNYISENNSKQEQKITDNKELYQENNNRNNEALIPAVARIISSQLSGEAPLAVSFSNDGSAASYDWDFGDGKAHAYVSSPTRIFDKPGEYKVTLTVKDSRNNVNKDYMTIRVKSSTSLHTIPNFFSPNGDYQNDKFEIKGEGLKSIEGMIIDPKTEKIIYTWSRFEDSWNGKFSNGSDAPEGYYYFIFKYIGNDDQTVEKKGLVELRR